MTEFDIVLPYITKKHRAKFQKVVLTPLKTAGVNVINEKYSCSYGSRYMEYKD